jgi:hypothetical protein
MPAPCAHPPPNPRGHGVRDRARSVIRCECICACKCKSNRAYHVDQAAVIACVPVRYHPDTFPSSLRYHPPRVRRLVFGNVGIGKSPVDGLSFIDSYSRVHSALFVVFLFLFWQRTATYYIVHMQCRCSQTQTRTPYIDIRTLKETDWIFRPLAHEANESRAQEKTTFLNTHLFLHKKHRAHASFPRKKLIKIQCTRERVWTYNFFLDNRLYTYAR